MLHENFQLKEKRLKDELLETNVNPLDKSFYQGDDVLASTASLLGKKLCTSIDGQYTSGMIVEAEAYRGRDDLACHAYPNRHSAKWEAMYLSGGHAYVYICYGIHALFNIVTGKDGIAEVALIRAIQPIDGLEIMQQRRKASNALSLTNGPGKLSQALGISKQHDKEPLFGSYPLIWLEDFQDVEESTVITGPRVGLSTAMHCMNWPWRYRIKDNPYLSKPNKVWYHGW